MAEDFPESAGESCDGRHRPCRDRAADAARKVTHQPHANSCDDSQTLKPAHKKSPVLPMLAMSHETLQTGAVAETRLNQFAKISANATCSYRAGTECRTFAPD